RRCSPCRSSPSTTPSWPPSSSATAPRWCRRPRDHRPRPGPGRRPVSPPATATGDNEPVRPVIPDVLAARYASTPMVELWSPEHKVRLERELWVAVMRAQRDLGVDIPAEAIDDYRAVVDTVDLTSIEARERAAAPPAPPTPSPPTGRWSTPST